MALLRSLWVSLGLRTEAFQSGAYKVKKMMADMLKEIEQSGTSAADFSRSLTYFMRAGAVTYIVSGLADAFTEMHKSMRQGGDTMEIVLGSVDAFASRIPLLNRLSGSFKELGKEFTGLNAAMESFTEIKAFSAEGFASNRAMKNELRRYETPFEDRDKLKLLEQYEERLRQIGELQNKYRLYGTHGFGADFIAGLKKMAERVYEAGLIDLEKLEAAKKVKPKAETTGIGWGFTILSQDIILDLYQQQTDELDRQRKIRQDMLMDSWETSQRYRTEKEVLKDELALIDRMAKLAPGFWSAERIANAKRMAAGRLDEVGNVGQFMEISPWMSVSSMQGGDVVARKLDDQLAEIQKQTILLTRIYNKEGLN